jgi:type III secretion protein N (ATPase)
MRDDRVPVENLRAGLRSLVAFPALGRVESARGNTVLARLPGVRIGEICELRDPARDWRRDAEVAGFEKDLVRLTVTGDLRGFTLDAEIRPTARVRSVPVGEALLGRVIDSAGLPLDGGDPLPPSVPRRPLLSDPPPAMRRRPVDRTFAVGIRAIDGLLTCGAGQRVGIFGAPGGGKSTLLASLVRGAEADVCVVGLVGERGREVGEFVGTTLGQDARRRCVVVAETSDRPAVARVNAAHAATAIAEHFRDEGLSVLLLVDSLTRFARASRDVALAAGDLPVRRGFPTSVFAALPALLERSGQGAQGAITAFYTVLVEGDGTDDPIAEEVRGILDGHIVLSAELGARGHYPAIDIRASKSRVMPAVTDAAHRAAAAEVVAMTAKYDEVEFLVQVGEYRAGSDAGADRAIARRAAVLDFLRQPEDEIAAHDETRARLAELVR